MKKTTRILYLSIFFLIVACNKPVSQSSTSDDSSLSSTVSESENSKISEVESSSISEVESSSISEAESSSISETESLSSSENESSSIIDPNQITNIKLSKNVLTWDALEGVSTNNQYSVQIGHYVQKTIEAKYDLSKAGTQSHISNHTKVTITFGEKTGNIFVSNSGDNVIQSVEEKTKLATVSNVYIYTDAYSQYLRFDRVSNDYPGTASHSAFYIFYYGAGTQYIIVCPSPAATQGSINLGAISDWTVDQDEVKIVTIGHSDYANSDPAQFTLKKENGTYSIVNP